MIRKNFQIHLPNTNLIRHEMYAQFSPLSAMVDRRGSDRRKAMEKTERNGFSSHSSHPLSHLRARVNFQLPISLSHIPEMTTSLPVGPGEAG